MIQLNERVVSEDMKKILILLVAVTCLVSCRVPQKDEPIVRYRLIGQIEAFQEDGGVRYSDFVEYPIRFGEDTLNSMKPTRAFSELAMDSSCLSRT